MDSVDRESLDATEDIADDVEDDSSEVSHELPSPPAAPAVEGQPAAEADAKPESSAPPVAADSEKKLEEAPVPESAHETVEPPRSTKRPPELPASVHPAPPVQAVAWPTRDRGRAFRIGAAALAMVLGIAIGGVIVARKRAAHEAARKPVAQTVSALPVVISAPVPDSVPSASAEPAVAESAAAPPAPSESPPSEPAKAAAEPARETPSTETKSDTEQKGSSSGASEGSSGKHRSSGAHNTPNAGYKPGGI